MSATQAREALREAAERLVDDWVGDDDAESEPFCWTCGVRRDLPHDDGCTFVALRAALAALPDDGREWSEADIPVPTHEPWEALDHTEHFDPNCEECAYLARPTRETLALPDDGREPVCSCGTWKIGQPEGHLPGCPRADKP